MKIRNTLVIRIGTIIIVLVLSLILIVWLFFIVTKSMNELSYDLGEKNKIGNYSDKILKTYNEYSELVKKYNLTIELSETNFKDNYYIASFVEYDSCAESKLKEVESVNISDTIHITYKVFNKCGWCRPHIALHLIKVDRFNEEKQITYEYSYQKTVDCGVIK